MSSVVCLVWFRHRIGSHWVVQPLPAACSLDLYAHADCFFFDFRIMFLAPLFPTFVIARVSSVFMLFFRVSYPIFPILRVLCSERFFFFSFLGGSDWKPKAFIPGKKSFRQRLSYPLRLPEEKKRYKVPARIV